MTKYRPLYDRLSAHPEDEWRASFAELEEVLGFPLPKSARGGPSWWANDAERGASRAWSDAGWLVVVVDCGDECVTFRRNMAAADIEATSGLEPQAEAPLTASAPDGSSRRPGRRLSAPAVAAGVAG